MSSIGERLRAARKEKGLTQSELAERLGISFVGVSQWESGRRNPKKETLIRLAEVLNVPVSYFSGTDTLDDDKALDFLSRSWEHADYQLTVLQHTGGSPAEIEQWEHVCSELHKLHEEVAARCQTEQEGLPDRTAEIVEIFQLLNSKGQNKILEIVNDYAKIPEYQRQRGQE